VWVGIPRCADQIVKERVEHPNYLMATVILSTPVSAD
jgi:hypothetical protein